MASLKEQALPRGVAYDEPAKTVSSTGSDAKDYENDGRPISFITTWLAGHRHRELSEGKPTRDSDAQNEYEPLICDSSSSPCFTSRRTIYSISSETRIKNEGDLLFSK
jgi:hypothetical protein